LYNIDFKEIKKLNIMEYGFVEGKGGNGDFHHSQWNTITEQWREKQKIAESNGI